MGLRWYLFTDFPNYKKGSNVLWAYGRMKRIFQHLFQQQHEVVELSHYAEGSYHLEPGILLLLWKDLDRYQKYRLPKKVQNPEDLQIILYLADYPNAKMIPAYQRICEDHPTAQIWYFSQHQIIPFRKKKLANQTRYMPLLYSPLWLSPTLQIREKKPIDVFFFGNFKKDTRRGAIYRALQRELPGVRVLFQSFRDPEQQERMIERAKIHLVIHQFDHLQILDWNRINFFITHRCCFIHEQCICYPEEKEWHRKIIQAPFDQLASRCREVLSWGEDYRREYVNELAEWYEQSQRMENFLRPEIAPLEEAVDKKRQLVKKLTEAESPPESEAPGHAIGVDEESSVRSETGA